MSWDNGSLLSLPFLASCSTFLIVFELQIQIDLRCCQKVLYP